MDMIFFVVVSVVQFLPVSASSVELGHASLPKVSVKFKEAHEIVVGTPVFSNGRLVGGVSSVRQLSAVGKPWGDYEVELSFTSQANDSLAEGVVALLSSPMVSPKQQPRIVVELVVPSDSKPRGKSNMNRRVNGKRLIDGFASYEEFWRS